MAGRKREQGAGPIETSWEAVADWYDRVAGSRGTEFHQRVILPGVLRLLRLAPGEAVLDLACGQGVVSRALHRAGARVTGVDASERLVEQARRRSPRAIRYLVGDARRLEGLEDASFDAVTLVLGPENIDPLEPAMAEVARVLRPLGRLVMVGLHPAFRIPRLSRWFWDEERKLLARMVDRYLAPLPIPIEVHPFRAPGAQVVWHHHRPLQDLFRALSEAGLWVDALEEWVSHKVSQPGPMARAENRARAEFPLFLALRAVKVPEGWRPRPPEEKGPPPWDRRRGRRG